MPWLFTLKTAITIYAGAPAGGLWVSNDYGKTWANNTDTLPTLGVSAIAIDPKNSDTIYIGTGAVTIVMQPVWV